MPSCVAHALMAVVLLLAVPALAHAPALTEAENAWLERQRAVDGTKCCDRRDVHVGLAVEWRMQGGRYQVRIQGRWHDVPPGRLLRPRADDPSPWPGQALLFWSLAPHTAPGFSLWCFFPEPLT
jgi:hypothetical protein